MKKKNEIVLCCETLENYVRKYVNMSQKLTKKTKEYRVLGYKIKEWY